MRWFVLLLAVACAGALYFRAHAQRVEETAAAPRPARIDLSTLPPELRTALAGMPDPGELLRSAGALPGLGAIKRLVGRGGGPETPMAPFADGGTPRQLRLVRRDVRRNLAALNRLSDSDGASPQQAAGTLAEVYSAPILRALGPDGRRAFAERVAGRTQVPERVKVLGFEGIFVSQRRALARVVYRILVRVPSGRYIARAPQTWAVTLSRERGRWRFVQGFETR
jgi:hypothetical protein